MITSPRIRSMPGNRAPAGAGRSEAFLAGRVATRFITGISRRPPALTSIEGSAVRLLCEGVAIETLGFSAMMIDEICQLPAHDRLVLEPRSTKHSDGILAIFEGSLNARTTLP